uniref:Secreted protein n=1 Tax=Piliocolobus tephrosceles TaxID=591936 RepID=A0A8C9HCS1_9PRIM
MECAMLLFCFLMSPLPSSPPSLACILVGGLHTSTAHCDSWKCAGNWLSPSSPHALIWNSPSVTGNRSSTGLRLPA